MPWTRPALTLLDLGAIAASLVLAHLASNGPEGSTPALSSEGPIGEVRTYAAGRLAYGDAVLRFSLAETEGHFRYANLATNGPMIMLAVERGDEARVELNDGGRIVGMSVDGRRLLSPAESAQALHRTWIFDLVTLALMIGGYLLVRPTALPRPAPPGRSRRG